MANAPELTTTDRDTITEQVRAAYQRLYPTRSLPATLQASERMPAHRGITGITLAEGAAYGGMLVALWLDPSQAAQLAIEGGESADQLHVTLCYCPEMAATDDVTFARVVASLADVAAVYTEVTGKVGGFGRFFAGGSSEGRDVFYASPDIPRLDYLREAVVRALGNVMVYSGSNEHSYVPHITLAYLAPKAKTPANPPAIDLVFSGLTVIAGDRRVDIPFQHSDDVQYLGMFDNAYAYYAEKASARPAKGKANETWRFSSRMAFLEPSEWIQWLPGPGTYHHSLWGELKFTPDKLERFVQNFQSGVYGQQLPVDIDHELKLSGAVGYITDMRVGNKGAVEVKVDWNDRGKTVLAEDRFKYVSADYFEEWQDPVSGSWIRDVPAGMAITTHPHFKTDVLRPLAASEIDSSQQFGESRKETIGMSEAENKTPPAAEAVKLNLSEADIAEFRAFKEQGGLAKFTALVEQNQKLTTDVSALQADARKKRFTDIVRGRAEGSDGAQWRGDVDRHVAHMTQLAEAFGDESQVLKDYIADRTADALAFAEAAKTLTKPIGISRGGDHVGTAWEQIDAKAKEYAEANNVTIEQARVKVMESNPDLMRQYTSERRVVRTEEE